MESIKNDKNDELELIKQEEIKLYLNLLNMHFEIYYPTSKISSNVKPCLQDLYHTYLKRSISYSNVILLKNCSTYEGTHDDVVKFNLIEKLQQYSAASSRSLSTNYFPEVEGLKISKITLNQM